MDPFSSFLVLKFNFHPSTISGYGVGRSPFFLCMRNSALGQATTCSLMVIQRTDHFPRVCYLSRTLGRSPSYHQCIGGEQCLPGPSIDQITFAGQPMGPSSLPQPPRFLRRMDPPSKLSSPLLLTLLVLVTLWTTASTLFHRTQIQRQERQPFPRQRWRSLQESHGVSYEGRVPLRTGYGTHFAFIYVGSPQPQRVSVILDTGSHWMAFPCTGCR